MELTENQQERLQELLQEFMKEQEIESKDDWENNFKIESFYFDIVEAIEDYLNYLKEVE
jgi:uncharacterized protein YwgA